VSRAYVGVNHDDTTIPGIVIIRRDGTVAFRQIAEAKYDRLTTEQLFATIDRTLGRSGAAAMHGYGVLERVQVRADVETAKVGSLAVLVPLARQLAIGPMVGAHTSGAIDLDLAAVARAPLFNDTAALQLAVTAGPTVNGANAWNLGARAGVWLAVTPRWGVNVDFGARMNGLAEVDLFATLGLGVLLAWY